MSIYTRKFHTNELENKTVLITGGAGFIGSNIVEYLLKHNSVKVRVLDNLSNGFLENIEEYKSNPNFTFIEGDITDLQTCRDACIGVDLVTHQAALGSVPRSIENPLATHDSNVTGFINMLIAARDANVDRIVYASSSSVYGDTVISPKVEGVEGTPLSPYAVSKVTNEYYAGVFARTYNMKIIGLRYFNVYGPKQNPKGPYAAAIPIFLEGLLTNTPVYINGNGEQTRDFTFVENAVQANIKALIAKKPEAFNTVYNIALGDSTSINDVYKGLCELTGIHTPAIYREERPGDVKSSHADIELVKKMLDYQPQVRLREGLQKTFDWFKESMSYVQSTIK